MSQYAIRKINGLIFECPSPSIWNLVGAPLTLAYNGQKWVLTMVDRQGQFREGQYQSRGEAVSFISSCYGIKGVSQEPATFPAVGLPQNGALVHKEGLDATQEERCTGKP